jgi:hypothetical protein
MGKTCGLMVVVYIYLDRGDCWAILSQENEVERFGFVCFGLMDRSLWFGLVLYPHLYAPCTELFIW